MESITLADLCPQPAEFTLKSTGKTYRLRPVSVGDQQWMLNKYGDKLQEIFAQIRTQEICTIVIHQLAAEHLEEFAAQDVQILIEETGERTKKRLGGAELLKQMIQGVGEILEIFKALQKTIGMSQPVMEKIAAAEAEKKSLTSQESPSTGERFSTSSPLNTAGPLTISEASP
jgi:hypothetical protein